MRVPNGWHLEVLGDVSNFKNGLNFTKTDNGESIKIVGVGDFKGLSELKDTSNLEYIQVANNVSDEELLKSGDLLFVRSNGNKDLIGRCLYFPEVNERLSFSGFTIRGRVNHKKILPEYASYLLRSSFVKRQFLQNGGGTNISNLSQQILNDVIFGLPPLLEQQKIAQILSTWDKAIEKLEALIAAKQKRKKALMQQLLTGKKRFAGFEGEWKKYLIEELEELGLIELSRGNVISKVDIEHKPGNFPIYSSSVKNNGLFGCYGEYMFDEELITWSVDGGGHFFYRPKHKFSVTNVSGYMRIKTKNINYKFLSSQLVFLHTKLAFDYQSKAHPSVIRKLYLLYIPSIEEQQKIATVLSAADTEIKTHQKQLAALKQQKQGLMQQLLTGKKRVKVDGHV